VVRETRTMAAANNSRPLLVYAITALRK